MAHCLKKTIFMFKTGIFSGQTALVTGGGSGIGFTIAKQLLQYGAEVYIASRKQERLTQAAEQLGLVDVRHGSLLR